MASLKFLVLILTFNHLGTDVSGQQITDEAGPSATLIRRRAELYRRSQYGKQNPWRGEPAYRGENSRVPTPHPWSESEAYPQRERYSELYAHPKRPNRTLSDEESIQKRKAFAAASSNASGRIRISIEDDSAEKSTWQPSTDPPYATRHRKRPEIPSRPPAKSDDSHLTRRASTSESRAPAKNRKNPTGRDSSLESQNREPDASRKISAPERGAPEKRTKELLEKDSNWEEGNRLKNIRPYDFDQEWHRRGKRNRSETPSRSGQKPNEDEPTPSRRSPTPVASNQAEKLGEDSRSGSQNGKGRQQRATDRERDSDATQNRRRRKTPSRDNEGSSNEESIRTRKGFIPNIADKIGRSVRREGSSSSLGGERWTESSSGRRRRGGEDGQVYRSVIRKQSRGLGRKVRRESIVVQD